MGEKCRSCYYWDRQKATHNGYCRRLPPVPLKATLKPALPPPAVWPVTNSGDWCGEWKQEDQANAKP